MLTESKITKIMDMADFAEDNRLSRMIKDTMDRHTVVELSDDEVDSVAAAGITIMRRRNEKKV